MIRELFSSRVNARDMRVQLLFVHIPFIREYLRKVVHSYLFHLQHKCLTSEGMLAFTLRGT